MEGSWGPQVDALLANEKWKCEMKELKLIHSNERWKAYEMVLIVWITKEWVSDNLNSITLQWIPWRNDGHPWLFIAKLWAIVQPPFECEKGLFRAPLGLWPASLRRLSSDLMSNRLGSRSNSGWEADQLHKCAVWQARGFFTPQPRICAWCTNIMRACACFHWARCAFQFFSQLCIVLALFMCCGVNPCAMNDCFSVLTMRSSLSPCADEISVITDAPWWMRLGAKRMAEIQQCFFFWEECCKGEQEWDRIERSVGEERNLSIRPSMRC